MPVSLLRRILTILIVSAYFGASVLVVAPMANAASAPMGAGMMQQQDGMGDKMPCKGMMPSCMNEFGCIFMVTLPAPDLTISTIVVWSPVTYVTAAEFPQGRSIQPALGPPISRT
jgi:hypothetical protein